MWLCLNKTLFTKISFGPEVIICQPLVLLLSFYPALFPLSLNHFFFLVKLNNAHFTRLLPTAGPETSTVLEGILERWGGLWLPVRERTLKAVTQVTHLLFLCFNLFCIFFWILFYFSSFSFFPLLSLPFDLIFYFIGTTKSN